MLIEYCYFYCFRPQTLIAFIFENYLSLAILAPFCVLQ